MISTELKKENSTLVYITADRDENQIIDFKQYQANMKRVHELALAGKILSADTVGRGGIFIALAKMAVGNKIGADLENVTEKELRNSDYGALILEIAENENIEELLKGILYKEIGNTAGHQKLTIKVAGGAKPDVEPIALTLDEIIKKMDRTA